MPHKIIQEAPPPPVNLYAPFTSDTILEVRTGKMQPLRGLAVESGIDKALRHGPVRVTELGLKGDEHDPTFHGGLDKAIHGYCSSHYPTWQSDFPSAASAFVPGAFGENLVTAHLNERNLCIGDIVGEEAEFKPGAHARVRLGNGLVRAYSVVDGNRRRFTLGVALDENSRGGSRYLHETVREGDILQVGAITAAVPMASAASHHVFVAGGVGITAFLALVEYYKSIHYSVALHYAVRSAEDVPFRERLAALGEDVVIYDKAAGRRLDVRRIVENMPWNSQLYFCGPKRLMDEALRETRAHGIAEKEVHFEAFEADVSGDPFEAVVANKGGTVVKVGEEETLLECLQKEFGEIDSSCCVGNCGTCQVSLKDGRVDHRGTALTEEEKATTMLTCVSRGIGRITIEI
ncbi:hypothetical protein N0V88_000898 [Collariella sp. IMI 366227]|nr:hypothetical protein N0V88_000898 [Collariella sp. IMI 366227]